jgi:hypothetical protein
MYREDTACVEKLLIPAKRVLKQERIIKNDPKERRIHLWNIVRENFDKYLEGNCGRFLKDMDNHINGQFSAALLVLASLFKENGEAFEATEYFSDKELNAYKKISQYKIFDILSPAEIRNNLELHNDNVHALLHAYYFDMDPWVNSILNDSEINPGFRNYLKEKWENYRRIINNALQPEHEVWMHLILDYGKQHKEDEELKTESKDEAIERKQKKNRVLLHTFTENKKRSKDLRGDWEKNGLSQSGIIFTHHDIFISYSHEDKPVSDAICSALESANFRCWIAPRDILPGQNYPSAIIKAIEQCKLMVIVFSSKSNNSDHVIRELTKAVSMGIIIIPFRIENVPPSRDMEYLIGIPHWLDALTPPLERHIEKLIRTIEVLLEK